MDVKSTGILLLLLLIAAGCATKSPLNTSKGKEVLMEQRDVSLYRRTPKVWPAKGKVIATSDELIFVPSPYFGGLYINGKDSTHISLSEIKDFRKEGWMLLFPFGAKLITDADTTYDFISVRRNELIQSINQAKVSK
ncbi:hypothetical protein [Pontibacter mangrovi]|uniref:Lipoprotein n=1 Tax=Pontibacter mangrovi TaxID=2589816 RepID=A0A501W346_9BACT|nr:hypothetical protein [Pontibacter mangrovi]TPE42710.1 hypothetical protein FJM65_16745 [Pontibacter mangrovi]